MANLLTKQSKIKILWDKRMRVVFMFMVMSFFGLAVAAAALLPIGIYAKMILAGASGGNQVEEEVGKTTSPSFGKQRQEIIRELRGDKDLLEQVSTIALLPRADELLLDVTLLAEPVSGVELRLIALEAHLEQDLYTLRLSGTAVSRSSVVAVREAFEESEDFIVTDFPLGNLTPQSGEYNFVIELATQRATVVKQENNE